MLCLHIAQWFGQKIQGDFCHAAAHTAAKRCASARKQMRRVGEKCYGSEVALGAITFQDSQLSKDNPLIR